MRKERDVQRNSEKERKQEGENKRDIESITYGKLCIGN